MKNLATLLALCGLLLLGDLGYKYFSEVRVPEMDASLVAVSSQLRAGVVVAAASSRLGDGKTEAVDVGRARQEIEVAAALGADLVRFDLEREMLEKTEEADKLQEANAFAREQGLKVFISYGGRESWFGSASAASGRANFADFQKGYLEDVAFIMDRYHPDYILILPDCPSGPMAQVNAEVGSQQWFELAKDVALSIKKKSFDTQVVLEGDLYPAADARVEQETDFLVRVLSDNDPIFDVVSLEAHSAADLEGGMKILAQLQEKYHWHGAVWLGDVDYPAAGEPAGQEDYFLYALHLANSRGFGGVVFSTLCDGGGNSNGLMTSDLRAKGAYAAVGRVLKNRISSKS